MTSKAVEKVVHRNPFQPYRLVLDDGEEIKVVRPRKSHVSGPTVALVGDCRPLNGETQLDKFRIVPVKRVISAEIIGVDSK